MCKSKAEVWFYEAIEKTAAPQGDTARIYLPRHWGGKKVRIFLLEEAERKSYNKKLEKSQEASTN